MWYLCSECSYESDSMYHYRLHLSQQHPAVFTQCVRDESLDNHRLKCGYCPFLADTEDEFSAHIPTHMGERRYKCSACTYSAYTRLSVKRHILSTHKGSDEVKVIDMNDVSRIANELIIGQVKDRTDIPLVADLEPKVSLTRMPESLLPQIPSPSPYYSDGTTEEEDDGDEEMEDGVEDMEGYDVGGVVGDMLSIHEKGLAEENDGEEDTDVEESREQGGDNLDNEDEFDGDKTVVEGVSEDVNVPDDILDCDNNVEKLPSSSCIDPSKEMVIMQLGSINGIHSPSKYLSLPVHHRSKDSLLSAQHREEDISSDVADVVEDDDDDDDDDDVYGNDVTLASPLPMIVLGEAVAMTPARDDNTEHMLLGL